MDSEECVVQCRFYFLLLMSVKLCVGRPLIGLESSLFLSRFIFSFVLEQHIIHKAGLALLLRYAISGISAECPGCSVRTFSL